MPPSRRASLLALGLALGPIGCASEQTRFSAVRMTTRTSDVYQANVVQNLARAAATPGALPSVSILNGGTTSVTDSGGGSLSLFGSPRAYTTGTYGLNASRSIQDNITYVPLHDPDRLFAIKLALRLALAPGSVDPTIAHRALDPYFPGKDALAAIPSGWAHVGCRRDVPKAALYVQHEGPTYVWVDAAGLDGLTQLTLVILNIATLDTSARVTLSVDETEGPDRREPGGRNRPRASLPPLPGTATTPEPTTSESSTPSLPARVQYGGFGAGLFLVPRP